MHTLFRVENAMLWMNFPFKKKQIVISSLINLIDLKHPNWRNNEMIEQYKKVNPLFNFDMRMIGLYTSGYTGTMCKEEIEENIKKAFK